MDIRRRFSLRRILMALVAISVCVWLASVVLLSSRLVIGPETTYVLGPLRSDGFVDYCAALHQRLSAGIAPADNAAILIDRAFGLAAISPDLRAQYFERIGIEPQLEGGQYILTQSALMNQKLKGTAGSPELAEATAREFERARQGPWVREDCPVVAEWLEINSSPMSLITEAAKRSRYYSPLVSRAGLMQAESAQNVREAGRLLSTRAMLRLGQHDVGGAWSDLLDCHRLAQLVSQRAPTMNSLLVAMALGLSATNGEAALIAYGLSAEQARECLADHAQLLPFTPLADVVDQGNRLETLDALIQQLKGARDINTLLLRANRTYDDFVSALRQGTFEQRQQAFADIETRLRQRIAASSHPMRLTASLITNSRESMGDVLLSLCLPAWRQGDAAQTRADVRLDLGRIGFALAGFRAQAGTFPGTLDELVPKYLEVLPVDRYSNHPLVYTRRADGFLVYSVGANLRDDEGRMGSGEASDDIAFEVPPQIVTP